MCTDEMKKKAKQICFGLFFIDSLFTDAVPVINNRPVQCFRSTLSVAKGIRSPCVCWNKHYQLEKTHLFQYLSGRARRMPSPPAAATHSDRELMSRTIQPLAVYKTVDHIRQERITSRHTHTQNLYTNILTPKIYFYWIHGNRGVVPHMFTAIFLWSTSGLFQNCILTNSEGGNRLL